jgi:hypothetical protein
LLTGRLFFACQEEGAGSIFAGCSPKKRAAALVWIAFSGKIELKLRWAPALQRHASGGCKK